MTSSKLRNSDSAYSMFLSFLKKLSTFLINTADKEIYNLVFRFPSTIIQIGQKNTHKSSFNIIDKLLLDKASFWFDMFFLT